MWKSIKKSIKKLLSSHREPLLPRNEYRNSTGVFTFLISYFKPRLLLPRPLQPLFVRAHEVKKGEKLSDGSFSYVFRAEFRGQTVALKQFRKQISARSNMSLSDEEIHGIFLQEVTLLNKAKHNCIIALLGIIYEPNRDSPQRALILEEAENGDLEEYLYEHRGSQAGMEPIRKRIMVELTQAIMYLHSLQIVHRDIKPENILLDKNLHAKLGDFGFAKALPPGQDLYYSSTVAGTPRWLPIESSVCGENGCITGMPSDVYGLGLILRSILKDYANYAYEDIRNEDLNTETTLIFERVTKKILPTIPNQYDPAVRSLITRSWDPSLKDRPTADEFFLSLNAIESFKPYTAKYL